jgi:hypothetical protein
MRWLPALCFCLFAGNAHAADTCWSVLKSPAWPAMKAALVAAKPCRTLKPLDQTADLNLTQADVCSAPSGVRIVAAGDFTCATSPRTFIQAKANAKVAVDATLDLGACAIVDSRIDVSGDIGKLVGNANMQQVLRDLAQEQLTKFCGLAP